MQSHTVSYIHSVSHAADTDLGVGVASGEVPLEGLEVDVQLQDLRRLFHTWTTTGVPRS